MKKISSKQLWAVLITVIIAVVLTACSPSVKPQPTEEPKGFSPSLDPQFAGTLNVVGHYSNFEALEEEFNLFSEIYPNVKLTYTYLEGYNNNIIQALGSDEAPDIFFTFPWMIENEKFDPVFEYTEDLSDETLKINLSDIRDGVLYKDAAGHISMLPIFSSTYGMLINEDIFEKEKIAIPTTYTEFLSACEALKKAGYKSPVMSYSGRNFLLFPLYYPLYCSEILGNETAVSDINAMKPGAGEYMRKSLELALDFLSHDYIDLEECAQIGDDYDAVIRRFFEGDVPMMMATANTVSGTEKRESRSEAFTANPFKYTFHPVPTTDKGGFFAESVALGFSVNKKSANLDIANEFIRFLSGSDELNRMAKSKRMVTPAKNMSLDGIYASFSEVPHINQSEVGLLDAADIQVRSAGSRVCRGEMTIDEAIAAFGTLTEK